MSYKVSIVIERDEHGYYAYCPELEGCQTQGDSLEDVITRDRIVAATFRLRYFTQAKACGYFSPCPKVHTPFLEGKRTC